jgi:PAS domain S-box-containing protein
MPQQALDILNSLPLLITRVDRDLRVRYANRAAAEHFGTTPEAMAGRTLAELDMPAAAFERHREINERVFADGLPVEYESPASVGNTARWLHLRVTPEFAADGTVRSAVTVINDVTELKRAEEALRVSEERFRLATAAAGVGIWEWNVLTDQIFWNAQMFDLYQVRPTADGLVTYDTWRGAVLPEDLAHQEAILRDTVTRRGNSARAFRIRLPDGGVRHIEAAEAVRTNARGQVEWVIGTNVDVSGRKVAEDALRASEERFRTFMDNSPAVAYMVDEDGRAVYINEPMRRHFGITDAEWLGKTEAERFPEEVARGMRAKNQAVLDGGKPVVVEEHTPAADGTTHVWQSYKFPLTDPAGRRYLAGMSINVTAEKRAVAEREQLAARFEAFMKHTPAVAWIKGPDGRTQLVSRKMAELFGGVERWMGKTDHEVLPKEVADVTAEHDRTVRTTGVPMEVVEEVPTTDGQVRPWLVVKFPIPQADGKVGTGGIALDLSERRKAEEERRKAEQRLYESLKLESLGVLAGGIAHDFNNLLTSMLGYASLAGMELSAGRGAALPAYLGHIETAAGRAADLCKQMLAYAGKGQFQVKAIGLNTLVEEMAQLLQASISRRRCCGSCRPSSSRR